ncbi:uncharacterized protein LOC127698804 [Mytilus californianus]|uniref:uncharacterized protein LOC127698804 n=1 Tax=Mytilus californianus TaxID=6549 RepID=UPI0022457E07|nr:uncharacterized protein LOC127698804 [Mytilus californianus]
MSLTERYLCNICKQNEASSTVIWCIDCEVSLCMECEKHHKNSAASKDHKTIITEDYHKLPSFMKETCSLCKDHDRKYELYCSVHACACCSECTSDKHNQCQDMMRLSEILGNKKLSDSVPPLEKDLKDIGEKFEHIIEYLHKIITTNKNQKTQILSEIKSVRKSIDDYLDKLESQILDELESKHLMIQSKMGDLVQQIEQRAKQIGHLQEDFYKMTQYATEWQTYVGLREMGKASLQEIKYVEDLESKGHIDKNNLHVNISSALQSILKDIKSFGDISITKQPYSSKVMVITGDEVQHSISKFPNIEQIKPTFLNTLKFPEGQKYLMMKLLVLDDGKFLALENHQKSLMLFGSDGFCWRNVVKFSQDDFPFNFCNISNNIVAVSLYYKHQVILVDIEKNKTIETIDISGACWDISCYGQTLAISLSDDAKIILLNLQDKSREIIEAVQLTHLVLFEENIYCTACSTHKVFCYKVTGEHVWTVKNSDIDIPEGIAVDMNGFVYIASLGNNSIVQLSPDGKSHKTVLNEEDGVIYPKAFDINRKAGLMIVSSQTNYCTQEAFVYNI